MLKKFMMLSFLLLVIAFGLNSCGEKENKPKLIVQVTIDGLKDGLLEKYDPAFKYGFRRLLDEGLNFSNASVNHAVTVSQAGHITIATGDNPSKHGIVDAAYYTTENGKRILEDCAADSTENILGYPKSKGASPKRILSTSIAEWVTHNDPNAKSLAVGSGDISPLLYSFEKNKDVYWYFAGKYVTSTFYKKEYPNWVKKFNEEEMPKLKKGIEVWSNSVPEKFRNLCRPDTAYYEGDKVNTTFPHKIENELARYLKVNPEFAMNVWFKWTPINDIATLKLAEAGIDSMKLGQRGATDYLSIVLSQVDGNSHYYGPSSMEIFDILLKIDKALGELMNHLDQKVGKGNYVIALTADHGFPQVVEYKQQINKFARRLKKDEIENFFNKLLQAKGSYPDLSEEANKRMAEAAEKFDFIADAYTYSELSGKEKTNDEYLRLYRNSFRKDRIPRLPLFSLETAESPAGEAGLMLRMKKGVMMDLGTDTHGTVYDYDRNVPLIFYGNKIKAGKDTETAHTIDVSPTLAEIAGIPVPEDVDGKALIK